MEDVTHISQKKTYLKQGTAKVDEDITIYMKPEDAVLLSPSLGMPAIVKKEKGKAVLELIILAKTDKLQKGSVAYHLRWLPWAGKDKALNVSLDDTIFKAFLKDKKTINVSKPYPAKPKSFGTGDMGPDIKDTHFKLKLAHLNVYTWIFDSLTSYPYAYKVSVNLHHQPPGLYNILWLNERDYLSMKEKPKWWNLVQHVKDLVSREYKKDLKQYGGEITDKDNIQATIYHPVYITFKEELSIGHITDIHLDSRMEIYKQSVASVVEYWKNCKKEPAPQPTLKTETKIGLSAELKFDSNGKRIVKESGFYKPLGKIIADFNHLFTDLCRILFQDKKADVIVITGDLIDYNRSIHTPQTYSKKPEKPGTVWDKLNIAYFQHALNKDKDNNDRNWFLFYKKLLQVYGENEKPVFTLLGNHDYVNYGMCPWPLGGLPWDGVYDQNLTLYESALLFGPGYNNSKEFITDILEATSCARWYTYFINPFADYVVNYGNQSLYMVDWATRGSVFGSVISGTGGLHHAKNLFRDNEDFNAGAGLDPKTTFIMKPFEIRNHTIYRSWINSKIPVKILFMHATAICPMDDVSIGEVNFSHTWADKELRYGTFDNRRDDIIKNVESGKLNMIVAGHSHRNVVMEVKDGTKNHPFALAHGEHIDTDYMEPRHLSMVTTSGGPLPKYLPGGPLICACKDAFNKYDTGFFYEKNRLYRYEENIKLPVLLNPESRIRKNVLKAHLQTPECPDCHMPASLMTRKRPKRHKPGANLLKFKNGKVKITSVYPDDTTLKLRTGPVCEKNGVFMGDMRLKGIDSFEVYRRWKEKKPIEIESVKPFTYYGYMEFPSKVKYITFLDGLLSGDSKVELVDAEKKYEKRVRQKIWKDSFNIFLKAAKNDSDFSFTRYTFKPSDIWDREIQISRTWSVRANDAINTALYNENERAMEEASFGSYAPKYKKTLEEDEFKGMILVFKKFPDFKKRKDKHVCGY